MKHLLLSFLLSNIIIVSGSLHAAHDGSPVPSSQQAIAGQKHQRNSDKEECSDGESEQPSPAKRQRITYLSDPILGKITDQFMYAASLAGSLETLKEDPLPALIAIHPAIVEWRLKNGANIDQTDQNGMTALMVAAAKGDAKAVRFLLERGADVNRTAHPRSQDQKYFSEAVNGPTALTLAAEHNHPDMVSLLLDANANPTLGNIYSGMDILQVATRFGHLNVCRCLIQRKNNVNQQDCEGATLLSYAMKAPEEKRIAVIRLLLENGAKPRLTDDNNETPLFTAAKIGNDEMLQLLFETDPDLASYGDELPVSLIAQGGSVWLLNKILQTQNAHTALNGTDNARETFLQRHNLLDGDAMLQALRANKLGMVAALVSYGATRPSNNLLADHPQATQLFDNAIDVPLLARSRFISGATRIPLDIAKCIMYDFEQGL